MYSWWRLYHNLSVILPVRGWRRHHQVKIPVCDLFYHKLNLQVHAKKAQYLLYIIIYSWMGNLACNTVECKSMQIRCKEWVSVMMENFFLAQRHPFHHSEKVNKMWLVLMFQSWLHNNSVVYLLKYCTQAQSWGSWTFISVFILCFFIHIHMSQANTVFLFHYIYL